MKRPIITIWICLSTRYLHTWEPSNRKIRINLSKTSLHLKIFILLSLHFRSNFLKMTQLVKKVKQNTITLNFFGILFCIHYLVSQRWHDEDAPLEDAHKIKLHAGWRKLMFKSLNNFTKYIKESRSESDCLHSAKYFFSFFVLNVLFDH